MTASVQEKIRQHPVPKSGSVMDAGGEKKTKNSGMGGAKAGVKAEEEAL